MTGGSAMNQLLIFAEEQIMEMHLKNKNKTQILQIRALNMSKNHSYCEWLPPAVLVNVHLEACLCLFLMPERHLNKNNNARASLSGASASSALDKLIISPLPAVCTSSLSLK